MCSRKVLKWETRNVLHIMIRTVRLLSSLTCCLTTNRDQWKITWSTIQLQARNQKHVPSANSEIPIQGNQWKTHMPTEVSFKTLDKRSWAKDKVLWGRCLIITLRHTNLIMLRDLKSTRFIQAPKTFKLVVAYFPVVNQRVIELIIKNQCRLLLLNQIFPNTLHSKMNTAVKKCTSS